MLRSDQIHTRYLTAVCCVKLSRNAEISKSLKMKLFQSKRKSSGSYPKAHMTGFIGVYSSSTGHGVMDNFLHLQLFFFFPSHVSLNVAYKTLESPDGMRTFNQRWICGVSAGFYRWLSKDQCLQTCKSCERGF